MVLNFSLLPTASKIFRFDDILLLLVVLLNERISRNKKNLINISLFSPLLVYSLYIYRCFNLLLSLIKCILLVDIKALRLKDSLRADSQKVSSLAPVSFNAVLPIKTYCNVRLSLLRIFKTEKTNH